MPQHNYYTPLQSLYFGHRMELNIISSIEEITSNPKQNTCQIENKSDVLSFFKNEGVMQQEFVPAR